MACTVVLAGAGHLWAGTGMLIVMPPPQKKPTSRLQMVVDTSWVVSQGYQPVRVTFRPIGKRVFPADRNLVVELRPWHWFGMGTRLEVSREIELPEGAESASTTVYLPQDGLPYYGCAVCVYEDGDFLSDLSDKKGITNPATTSWYGDELTAIAFVTYEVPSIYSRRSVTGTRSFSELTELTSAESVARLARLASSQSRGGAKVPIETWLAYQWRQITDLTPSFEYMNPADLPDLLPGLSSIDLILIERNDLARMVEEAPESLDLLRRWLLAGGNLCTTGGGDGFERRAEIESLFDLTPEPVVARHKKSGTPTSCQWRYPDDSEYGSLVVEFRNLQRHRGKLEQSKDVAIPGQSPFVIRPAEFGQLILTSADPFELDTQDWNWMFKSIPGRMWRWEVRQGLSMNSANDGFWDFMVPGVGLPPVTAFQVLITLFVLIIGPVNYFLLTRKRRLNWLMATVPLGSLVTILGLLGFALFTDGISIRARVHSLTHINQRTQHAVSLSRQSYYAGVAPADGLIFPEDTVVLPIEHTPVGAGSPFSGRRRVIEHRGDKMYYKVGYLPSRTTVQYTVTRSQTTDLKVTIPTTGQQSMVATNELGATIEALFYRDTDGELYWTEQLGDGVTAKLVGISTDEAREKIKKIMDRDRLEAPLGLDRSILRDGLLGESFDPYGVRRSRIGNRSSRLERTLGRLRNGDLSELSGHSYLAVVQSCAEVPIGVKKCEIRAALHIVMGQL